MHAEHAIDRFLIWKPDSRVPGDGSRSSNLKQELFFRSFALFLHHGSLVMAYLTLTEARKRLSFQEDTKVLSFLFDLRGRVRKTDWLKIAGEAWSRGEGTGLHAHWIYFDSPIAEREGPIREMMTKQEFAYLNSLESPITIYRGCFKDINDYDGNCYSLDRKIASTFPFYLRYSLRHPDAEPILLVATVEYDDVIAYKNCRNEQEIIIRSCKIVDELPLEAQEVEKK